jgi:hypothetical protein
MRPLYNETATMTWTTDRMPSRTEKEGIARSAHLPTRKSNDERAVPLGSSRKPKVESESEIDVGETAEEERTRRTAQRAGKEKANQARTKNVEDIPYSQPSTFNNNPFALHALPMPIFSPSLPSMALLPNTSNDTTTIISRRFDAQRQYLLDE